MMNNLSGQENFLRGKKGGSSGSVILSIYRVFLVTAIAFIVFGVSAMAYEYVVDVGDSEALILAREIVECVVPQGVLDLDSLDSEMSEDVFSYCGFSDSEMERFFVEVVVSANSDEVLRFEKGASELDAVRRLYAGDAGKESSQKYNPGYFKGDFGIRVLGGGLDKDGVISVEVVVGNDQ